VLPEIGRAPSSTFQERETLAHVRNARQLNLIFALLQKSLN